MSAGGMSQQLVDFSRVLVGHLRAGLAHASVVASMVFAGISGSSTADASAIASIVIPTMKQSGYKAGFAAALIATAGTIGAIIPPSMVMVVYGAIAQVSIGGLFLGGIIPGILVGLFLMATIKIYTYHPDYPELRVVHGRFEWGALARVAARGLAGAARAGDHRRRHPERHLHRHRGRRRGLPVRASCSARCSTARSSCATCPASWSKRPS